MNNPYRSDREAVHVAGPEYLEGQFCTRCDVLLVPPRGQAYPEGAHVVRYMHDSASSATWRTAAAPTCRPAAATSARSA